ncbi:MAG TPA: hypothetical protein VF175_15940 [Lacipirellula sp.]
MFNRTLMRATLITVFVVAMGSPAGAVDRTWDGGDSTWDNTASKWDPNGVPVNGDNIILETDNDVAMGVNGVVDDITMSGGFDLDTQGFLLLGDQLSVSGAGTDLTVDPRTGNPLAPALDVDAATINSGGRITLLGAVFELDGTAGTGLLDVNIGGTLRGWGNIQLDEAPLAAPTTLYANDGALTVGDVGGVIGNPPARTMLITSANVNARVDLDGTGGGGDGIVNVNRNATLSIIPALADSFDGEMNLGANATLSMNSSWSNGGVINVNSGAGGIPPQPAAPAHIGGGSFFNAGLITLDETDETLVFDAFFQQGGSQGITNNGGIVFNNDANIFPSTDFTMGPAATLTVNAGKMVGISADDFDLDPFNELTIGSGGSLQMLVGSAADGVLNGLTHLNGGTWQVGGEWTLGGTVEVGAATGTSQISGSDVDVNAAIIVGAGSTLQVNAPSTWNGAGVTVQNGATLAIAGGPITYNQGAGGSMTGPGTIIQAHNAVVTGQTFISSETYKWDGGTTTVNYGVPFFLDVGHIDTGGSDTHNHTINVSGALNVLVDDGEWELGTSGDLNLIQAGEAAPVLNGSRLRVLGAGRVDVDGDAFVMAPMVLDEGAPLTLVDDGVVEISGLLTLAGGDLLDDVDRLANDTQITVAGGLTVTGASTVDVERFNWDESATTIERFGALTVLADYLEAPGDPQRYDGTITNHGALAVDLGVHETWIMDGTLHLSKDSLVQPSVAGDVMNVGDDLDPGSASLLVSGSGQSNVLAKVRFLADANVNIATGSVLRTNDWTFFDSVNGADNASFTGAGTWLFGDTVFFEEATTINMPAGAVDLDGGASDVDGDVIQVDVPVVLNLATMHDYGNPSGNNTISIEDAGRLTVNLTDADSEWTVTEHGHIDYNGDAVNGVFLLGSDVNIDGLLSVSGRGQSNARIDVGGGAQVTISSAGGELTLAGGSLTDPNTINNGSIGNGILRLPAGRALYGFGVIGSTVDGPGTAEVRADNGTLRVTGAIADLNFLGTADDDGELLMDNAWNTSVVAAVDMRGGELTGATITNDGVIQGFGLVAASQLMNNGRVSAGSSGTLVLDRASVPAGYDWDGAGGNGVLEAVNGNLTLRGSGLEPFDGTLNIGVHREAFVDGFGLQHTAGSQVVFAGGVYRSNAAQSFGGVIEVSNAPSEIDALGTFPSGGAVNLAADLHLRQDMTIAAGATFMGAASLVNLGGATLTVASGANVGVTLENQGSLVLGASPGEVSAAAFEQAATGSWMLELGGTAANQYDRLSLTGAATLAGALKLSTIDGYIPMLGDMFEILSAPGGVSGAFTAVTQPAGMPAGLLLDVIYAPTAVQLAVVQGPIFSADFDVDGDVDGDDLAKWQADFGPTAGSDADDDGDSDGADLLAWQRQLGSAPAVTTATGVPEPAGAATLVSVVAVAVLRGFGRRASRGLRGDIDGFCALTI